MNCLNNSLVKTKAGAEVWTRQSGLGASGGLKLFDAGVVFFKTCGLL